MKEVQINKNKTIFIPFIDQNTKSKENIFQSFN